MKKNKYCTEKVNILIKKVQNKIKLYDEYVEEASAGRNSSAYDSLSESKKMDLIKEVEARAGITDAALVNVAEENKRAKITLGSTKRARIASNHRTLGK